MNKRQPTKVCVVCGRHLSWRKKWKRNWQSVKYCSRFCAKTGLNEIDRRLEEGILNLLRTRKTGSTVCPSEATRSVISSENWRDYSEKTLRAARRLVNKGKIVFSQRGKEANPSTARGPIRLSLK
jgi:hypothetical protein